MLAGQDQEQKSEEALEHLCRTYWYPLYSFVRRLGHASPDAKDLTQSFFVHLLQTRLVAKASPDAGKFRSFLLVSLKHFLSSQRDREQAQKRGGGQAIISLDVQDAEGRYGQEPKDESNPEAAYEQAWAMTVLDQAITELEKEYEESRKRHIFQALRIFLLGEKVPLTYVEVSKSLGTTEAAVKMLVQRMRRRYRECLRAVVAQTVASPDEAEEELRHLVQVLSG